MKTVKSIRLFFQEGASDKLYNADIVEDDDKTYSVRVQWGRRGRKLNEGKKALGATLEQAERAYQKVVRDKTRKGYEEIADDVSPAAVAPPVGEGSGSKAGVGGREKVGTAAQLLNAIDADRGEALIADDAYIAQQKFDGMRLLLHVREQGLLVATNRGGEATGLEPKIAATAAKLPSGTILDGELVSGGKGPTYWVFDLIEHDAEDLREEEYLVRYGWLLELGLKAPFRVVPTARTTKAKRSLLRKLETARAEGIVFKRADAPYTPGRPASGGAQLKYKFVKTADVLITANAGNAYQMTVLDDGGVRRDVGKVFAGTTNDSRKTLDELLAAGTEPVSEVQYLYATDADQLFQPVFCRIRHDKPGEQCRLSQLIHTNREAAAQTDD